MRVIFSPDSEIDLDDIAAYIAIDNPERAFSFVEEIVQAASRLDHFPERHAVLVKGRRDYRCLVHGRYRILYSVETDHVRIARVIHGRRLIRPDMLG